MVFGLRSCFVCVQMRMDIHNPYTDALIAFTHSTFRECELNNEQSLCIPLILKEGPSYLLLLALCGLACLEFMASVWACVISMHVYLLITPSLTHTHICPYTHYYTLTESSRSCRILCRFNK